MSAYVRGGDVRGGSVQVSQVDVLVYKLLPLWGCVRGGSVQESQMSVPLHSVISFAASSRHSLSRPVDLRNVHTPIPQEYCY